jgi:hypothetical protein
LRQQLFWVAVAVAAISSSTVLRAVVVGSLLASAHFLLLERLRYLAEDQAVLQIMDTLRPSHIRSQPIALVEDLLA